MSKRVVAAGLLVLLLAACGSDGDAAPGAGAGAPEHAHDHHHGEAGAGASPAFSFGRPGNPVAASETIEIYARDPYRFKPERVMVFPGDTVTFVVTNDGDQEHEFVLGDREYQESHGEEMAAGAVHHEGNAVSVAPGETRELTWTFPMEGEVLYACHVAGHYQGGMVGVVRIGA